MLYPTKGIKTIFTIVLLTFATVSWAQPIDTTFLYKITNKSMPDHALALAWDGTNNRPVLHATNDSPTQIWKIRKDKYGNFRLQNTRQGSTFSVEVVNDADKKNLVLGATKDVASQAWKITSNRDGTYRINSLWLGTEKSLEVVAGAGPVFEINMNAAATAPAQQWILTRLPKQDAPAPARGTAAAIDTAPLYRLTTSWLTDSKALGVTDETTYRPLLADADNSTAQSWKLVAAENGLYRIVNQQYPDRGLDVINDGTNNQLTLSPTGNYSGQLWKFTPVGGGFYRITSLWQGDGKSIDVVNDDEKNKVILNPTGRFTGQFWKLSKAESVVEPTVKQTPVPQTPKQTTPVANETRWEGGKKLLPGEKLVSPNGKYTFIMQTDGNLVLYKDKTPLWASGTNGKDVAHAIMQADGNLVVYGKYNIVQWAANTHGNEGAWLAVQNDGNVVIYSRDNDVLWATNTQGK